MRFAYSDPPYLGCAHLYSDLHSDALKWNDPATHQQLVKHLAADFPDGWALSLSSTSLQTILPFCPSDVRVMAWAKPFCNWKGSVNPAYAWEPVLFSGGRSRLKENPKVLDFLVCNAPLQTGCPGAKPFDFAFWIFRVLGAIDNDDFVDLFPGSGNMSKAWDIFTRQLRLYS